MNNKRKENLEHEICYHKFVNTREETGLRLTFSFTSFSIIALDNFDTNKMLTRKKSEKYKTGRKQGSPLLLLVNSKAKTMKS